ncbi:diguanylate cyclase domain-containing protein, partial [Actinosynnema sp. NPDC059797]
MGAYYTVPIFVGTVPLRVVLYCAISASAAAAVWWGVRRNRPEHRAPWVLLGLGQLVYALADTTFYVSHYVLNETSYPSIADVFYIGHYPLVIAGLVVLIRQRRSHRDLPGLLDAASLTVGAGLLSWVFVIGPQTRLGTPLLVEVASLAYPLMDLVVLLVSLRLLFGGGGRRDTSFVLLSAWLAAILTADTVYVLQRLDHTYAAGNFLDAIWLTGNLALGACALHPSMGRIAQAADVPALRLSWPRLAVLCLGALVGPLLLLLQHAQGVQRDVPAIAVGCAVLFALTTTRLAGLAVDQRRIAITDGLTGLRSRRYFEARLADDVARAERTGGPLAVVILDVDRFKRINDRFGHPGGDRVLVEVADRLRAVAGPGHVLARYGGEEFALITTGADAEQPTPLAERLRHAVARDPITV